MKVIRTLIVLTLLAAPAFPAVPRACTGSISLGSFRIAVRRLSNDPSLPIKSLSAIPANSRLIWDPVRLSPRLSDGAEVAAILVPAPESDLIILEPRKARRHAEWDLPKVPGVVAIVLGPHGLSMGKVKSLVARNQDLLVQLADYAEQTSEVEALVQELADSEQSGGRTEAALKGFSARYGVAVPKLDAKASTDQQASLLLGALLPSANTYDPLAPAGAQIQQSGGLAASVAGLFFGNTVGLVAGGAALFENLRMVMFPGTEFRSAFAQTDGVDGLALCTKIQAAKSRTRTAFLWAYRVPGREAPIAALSGPSRLAIGSKSSIKFKLGGDSSLKDLSRASQWRLVPTSGGTPVPVTVASAADSLQLDLSKAETTPGEYRLTTTWDWDTMTLGALNLLPYSDFSRVRFAPGSRDKLVEGNGTVTVQLAGSDFEFVQKVAVGDTPAHFRATADSLFVDLNTAARGSFRLSLVQSDGVPHQIPYTVLPPNPKVANLPARANLGETSQAIRLSGTFLDRIETVSSDAGRISGALSGQDWIGRIWLNPAALPGQKFSLVLQVKGLEAPLTLPNAVQVEAARPRITSLRRSVPSDLGIEIHDKELPSGTTVGLVFGVENLHSSRPRIELTCEKGELRHALSLATDEQSGGAKLSFAGSDALYLSIDPGAIGYPGCVLAVQVTVDPQGTSDPYPLGRVVRFPRLDQFTLTAEPLGPSTYAAALKGRDLDVIEKTGWDADHGLPVDSIPTPLPAEPSKETLRAPMSWPAPAPHAPLYIWLRGEAHGRKTAVAF